MEASILYINNLLILIFFYSSSLFSGLRPDVTADKVKESSKSQLKGKVENERIKEMNKDTQSEETEDIEEFGDDEDLLSSMSFQQPIQAKADAKGLGYDYFWLIYGFL